MKDKLGIYYHPDPSDYKTRVYVRQGADGPEFRLWRADHPQVWEKHGWLGRSVIEAAAKMYRSGKGATDPLVLYDTEVAKALIKAGA